MIGVVYVYFDLDRLVADKAIILMIEALYVYFYLDGIVLD